MPIVPILSAFNWIETLNQGPVTVPACIILFNTCCQKIICALLLLLIWDEQLKRRSLCVSIQFALNRAQCFAVNQPLEVLRSPSAQWVSSQFIFDSLSSPPTSFSFCQQHTAGLPVCIFGLSVERWVINPPQPPPPPPIAWLAGVF